MKVTEKNYGVQVKFTKEDPTIHYDGTFISDECIAFKPTEAVRVVFTEKEPKASYKAHVPFSVQNHVCTSGKCRYNLCDVLSENKSECAEEIITTGWVGMSKEGIPTGIYHNRTTNEFVQMNVIYATIVEKLKDNNGRLMMKNSFGNLVLIYQQDELIGGVMLITFKSGGSRIKIENI